MILVCAVVAGARLAWAVAGKLVSPEQTTGVLATMLPPGIEVEAMASLLLFVQASLVFCVPLAFTRSSRAWFVGVAVWFSSLASFGAFRLLVADESELALGCGCGSVLGSSPGKTGVVLAMIESGAFAIWASIAAFDAGRNAEGI